MINNLEFIDRIKNIMEHYQLSAAVFADKINVQRSSISHLLSGRNKPSLDFVLKVLEVFKEVDVYWLLNGKGSFPKEGNKSSLQISKSKTSAIGHVYSTKDDDIDKIIIFYKDGSFKSYDPLAIKKS